MNDHNEEPKPVTRTLIPEEQRLAVTAELFGAHFPLHIEPVVYGTTMRMAHDYRGGYWDFWLLSNDNWPGPAFYMSPASDQVYQVSCDNYWQGKLSANALGVVSCLYAFSHLSFGGPESFARTCASHYYRLRNFMMDHAEVAAILGAVD